MRADSDPLLILPVENQVRELDSKLLFGCFAVEKGFEVLIGSRPYVNFAMTKLRPGIFVAKSMRRRSALMLKIIQNLGHRIVAWDEESLVRFKSAEYNQWRFSNETFAPIEHLFAWGKDDARMFREYEGLGSTAVHITGNPRMDLLRQEFRNVFEKEVNEIKEKFGSFVLINTNFSFVNSYVSDLNLLIGGDRGAASVVSRTGEGMSNEFARGMFAHQEQIAGSFASLISKIGSEKRGIKFILRPHPSENHSFWRELVSEFPNIEMIHRGNVVPWILASTCLLHNGCTTAVEAAVLGKPAITYQKIRSVSFDYCLPNGLSLVANSELEAVELIETLVQESSHQNLPVNKDLLQEHLSALEGPFASERILQILASEINLSHRHSSFSRTKRASAYLMSAARTALKKINSFRKGHRNSKAYHDHRFPRVTLSQLQKKVATLDKTLGRFASVRIHQFSENLFIMKRDK
tara:strand:- start:4 stop:1398 length:1395 start_codon:yes stop_codon:yes gene_type:complete